MLFSRKITKLNKCNNHWVGIIRHYIMDRGWLIVSPRLWLTMMKWFLIVLDSCKLRLLIKTIDINSFGKNGLRRYVASGLVCFVDVFFYAITLLFYLVFQIVRLQYNVCPWNLTYLRYIDITLSGALKYIFSCKK